MQYYKLQGTFDKQCKEDNCAVDAEGGREMRNRIKMAAAEYNEKDENTFCFAFSVGKQTVSVGIIAQKPIDPVKVGKSFAAEIGFSVKEMQGAEVTFFTLNSALTQASRRDYIEDADKVLELFGLQHLENALRFGENLTDEGCDKEALVDSAGEWFVKETLLPELDRIFAGKRVARALGHPVHYILETDDRDTRREVYRILLNALYACGRIRNRRYAYLDFRPGEHYSREAYEALYQSCNGGAVVVRYQENDEEMEENYAAQRADVIENICRMARAYRNRVLTVICLPRACRRVKASFYEYLDTMSFVELREDLVKGEQCAVLLRQMAKEQGVRADKRLLGTPQEDRSYLAAELRVIFEEWYNDKLKSGVYPQYKEISAARKEVGGAKPRGTAYDELEQMIGLSEAKAVIQKALNYYKMQQLYVQKGVKRDNPAMHMVFSGNPGTAKTTVARLFARIMRENGLLSKGHLVEVGRGDLVGKYVGWTAQTVQKKFKEAKGGVLFIDEAYSLVDDRGGSYGDEAINTIVQEMENHRADVVVIFAGYPEQMEGFLQKNPGLRSRVAFHVPFADYSSAELCDITRLIGKKNGMEIEEAALEKLAQLYESARTQGDFGNGRYVRNMFEQAKMNQATRLLAGDFDAITTKDVITITAADILLPEVTRVEKRRVGFC